MAGFEFTVHGLPEPQGSKTRTRYGMRESNESLRPWRNAVAYEAIRARGSRPALTGPVLAELLFVFPRLRAHFGSGRNGSVLRVSAPVWRDTKPDLDKICRSAFDSFAVGGLVRNDAQIVGLVARKVFGDAPRMDVWLFEADSSWFPTLVEVELSATGTGV